jgi:arylsulfatase A-like enzyme
MKAFIRDNREGPFFAYGAWTLPHSRWELPEDDPAWLAYKDKPWPLAARTYAAFTAIVDRQVGDVLALLEELNLSQNTVVVFTSDNGGLTALNREPLHSNAPLRGGKTTLYEGGLRVPLVARWPGRIAPGSVSDHVTYSPDMFPTLAELAGITDRVTDVVDGISLLPELIGADAAGRSQDTHTYLYWEDADIDWNAVRYRHDDTLRQAVRAGDWKAYRPGPGEPVQLFNLKDDIGETRDVAADHPDTLARLERYMAEAHELPPPQVEPERLGGRSYR